MRNHICIESSSYDWLKIFALHCVLALSIARCGSDGTSGVTDDTNVSQGGNDTTTENETINTEKLIGTPFENLTTGDDFSQYYFLCDQYETNTIDSFPIYIFLAFFTPSEEEIIQEGVIIANEGIGFEAYVIINSWEDDARVIYKVDELVGAATVGQTYSMVKFFNGHFYSEVESSDWAIEVRSDSVSKWVIAHELGHTSGINGHGLIDYENDTRVDLEPDSLMDADLPSEPVLTDYNFMMQMQGQIMLNHLGEAGDLHGSDCDGLKE